MYVRKRDSGIFVIPELNRPIRRAFGLFRGRVFSLVLILAQQQFKFLLPSPTD